MDYRDWAYSVLENMTPGAMKRATLALEFQQQIDPIQILTPQEAQLVPVQEMKDVTPEEFAPQPMPVLP